MSSDNIYHQKVSFIVSPFLLPHNVPNCGYIITSSSFGRLIYATDTSSLDGLEAPNFDLYLIEANYTEIGIKERIEAKESAGEYVYEYGAQENHLSKEACDRFLMANMGEHSEFCYMHQHKEAKFKEEIL